MTRWVGGVFAVALGAWGPAVQAQTSMGFIISGDCRDPDLSQNARQLARELKAKLGDRLVTDEALKARLSPQPAVSAEDLGRQLEAAETLFYNGEHTKADRAIARALEDVRRFPPGTERWKLTVRAELLQSQVIRRLGRVAEADELFRHVLRLQPGYQLDPDYFMPSMRQRFERLRKELHATRRVRVEVKSLPAGAEIFLDGVKQGTTPAALEVWPGDYELIVARAGQRSLPHQLAAYRENAILVDLQFEGAIQLDRDPCFAARPGDKDSRLAGAQKIAMLVGVDSMVVLHLLRPSTGPASLVATVLDTQSGQDLLSAAIKLQGGTQPAPVELAGLALKLVAVDAVKHPPPSPPVPARPPAVAAPAPAPALGVSPRAAPAVAWSPVTRPPPAAPARDWFPQGWRGDAALGLGSAGAAVALAGGVLFGIGKVNMAVANDAARSNPSEGQLGAISQQQQTANIQQNAGVAAAVVGGLGILGAGVLLQVDPATLGGPSAGATSVSVGVSSGGAAVQVRGAF